jgi:cytoskeletal protein CcmA (bactofilin family)
MADSSQEYGTIIGADANFKGEISFDSAAKVLGRFEGSIKAKGKVFIADGSQCKASIEAKEIAIEGQIEGNLEATDRVEVKPTGQVHGDIVAARMTMADGASLDGHVRIGSNGQGGGRGARGASTEVKPAAQTEKPATQGQAQPAGRR